MAKSLDHLPYQAWNPVTGCTKLSPGCDHCYAERIALRLQRIGTPKYVNGFVPTLHPRLLNQPLKWTSPRLVFVNSMSDLFHQAVPLEFLLEVFSVMERAWWHEFMIITKRSGRLAAVSPQLPWPVNLRLGVTVESAQFAFRVKHLQAADAPVKFVTFTPLIGPPPAELDLTGIDWVGVGPENGAGARPMNTAWEAAVFRLCETTQTPCIRMTEGGELSEDGPAVARRRVSSLERVRSRRGQGQEQLPLPLG